jgi:diacylglycerol kinase (ATP)
MSITKPYHALKNSLAGMKALWRYEQAFRLEVYLFTLLLPVILLMPAPAAHKFLLILLFILWLVVETLNSAIETVVDRISTEFHEKSKIAKDLGSAAVFMVIIMNILAWIYVLAFAL